MPSPSLRPTWLAVTALLLGLNSGPPSAATDPITTARGGAFTPVQAVHTDPLGRESEAPKSGTYAPVGTVATPVKAAHDGAAEPGTTRQRVPVPSMKAPSSGAVEPGRTPRTVPGLSAKATPSDGAGQRPTFPGTEGAEPGARDGSALVDVPGVLEPDPSEIARGPAREFFFTRAVYGGHGRRIRSWRVDFPEADYHFLYGLDRLTVIDAHEKANPVALTDPELFRYPFLYALEVGYMRLDDAEVEALRRYLGAGGFLFVDDFWGTAEWQNFEREIGRVLPGREIVELPLDHPLFSTFYEIEEILQVPGIRNAGGPVTWERDGYVPRCRGIFDDEGHLVVFINWNTDLGDAWEWADSPYYPLPYSNFACKLAVNAIVYAMSH